MEINTSHRKRYAPRVDLTAMVDLGFLLITFFMLASAFSRPYIMNVMKPVDGDPLPYPQSKTGTILIGPGDMVFGYSLPDGLASLASLHFDTLDYTASGVRGFILRRQAEVEAQYGSKDLLLLIIKPVENASYARMVDVLDEVLITGVQRYAIVNQLTAVDSMILD